MMRQRRDGSSLCCWSASRRPPPRRPRPARACAPAPTGRRLAARRGAARRDLHARLPRPSARGAGPHHLAAAQRPIWRAPPRRRDRGRNRDTMGVIHIETERATLHMNLVVEPAAPHLIGGLLLTGTDLRGDSMAAVAAELRALPGEVSLRHRPPRRRRAGDRRGHEPERPLAIGSAFKLWILAELSRQVRAGQRRWSDTSSARPALLRGRHAPCAGRAGAPVTLHTLASLMISISDNTRDRHAAASARPRECRADDGDDRSRRGGAQPAASLDARAGRDQDRLGAAAQPLAAADEAGRRALLANDYAGLTPAGIDVSRFSGNPLNLDVEWFASPADLVRTMDWLRRNGDEATRAILAISSGLPAGQRGGFAYRRL